MVESMTTHLSNKQIENYCERRLSLADLACVNAHLFSCKTCYDQFLSVFQVQRRFPIEIDLNELAGLKSWHLQGDELKNYVEGQLGEPDLELANMHLSECAWCREEVHHVAEFTDKLQYYLTKRHAPRKKSSLRQWRFANFNVPYGRPLVMARAAALILVVVGSAIIFWLTLRTKPEAQAVRLPASVQEIGSPKPNVSNDSPNTESRSVAQANPSSENDKTEGVLHSGKRNERSKRFALSDHNRSVGSSGEQAGESPLIAENLMMPRVIEIFDRTLVVLRGNDSQSVSFSVLSPYATVIRDEQPTFHWTTLTGAEHYTVSIYDASLNLVEKSEPLAETHWLVPRRLKRGVIYTWIVTALKDGKEILAPTLPARSEFKVIEKPALDKLNRSIKHINSAVTRSVLYARAGLLDSSEQELRAHLMAHPDDETAKNILRKIKAWREP